MATTGFFVAVRADATPTIQGLADEKTNALADATLNNARRTVAVRTGRLRRDLHKEKVRQGVYLVGADTPYARFVEVGTSRMAAQPYLRPALAQATAALK